MTSKVDFFPLADRFSIALQPNPELEIPPQIEQEVESIWQKEKEKKKLFNSFIFSLTSFNERHLLGRFVEYRHFIASRKSKELQDVLQVYPLGVSGLCLCNDTILVGVRDTSLSSYGGYFECVPSGGIEARAYMHGEVDFVAQAMWELSEEAKLGEKHVKEVRTLGLYFCRKTGVYDIGLLIRVDLTEQEMELEGTKEYPLLEWYSFDAFENTKSKIVPLSKALWNTFRSL